MSWLNEKYVLHYLRNVCMETTRAGQVNDVNVTIKIISRITIVKNGLKRLEDKKD